MRMPTFDRLFNEIYAAFGKNAPTGAVRDRCAEKVARVPEEVAGWIQQRIENMDKMPANLSAAILGLWNQWRRENPHRCREEKDSNPSCPHCTDGWVLIVLPVVRSGVQVYAEEAARCGYCGRMEAYPSFAHVRQEQIDVMNAVTGTKGIPTKEQRALLAGRGEKVQEQAVNSHEWGDVARRAPQAARTIKQDRQEREQDNLQHVRGQQYRDWEDYRAAM